MRTSRRATALVSASLAFSIACSSGESSPPTPPAAPAIALAPASLSFTAQAGGANPAPKTVTITNSGGGTFAAPTLEIAYASGSGWLGTPTVTGTFPYDVTMQPVTAGLAAGSYAATVTVSCAGAANSPQTLAVSLEVTAAAPVLALSPAALTFTASLGGPAPLAQQVAVSNLGSGTLAAPATTIQYDVAGGPAWLGATVSASAPYTISVQPNPAGLAAGTYGATVSVASVGATNTPQAVDVSLTVVDGGGTQPAMLLSTTSLSFAATAGGADPAAQQVRVSNLGGGSLVKPTASIAYAPGSGSGWLGATVTGTAAPFTVSVQPTVGALAAGSYEATVSISSAGASNDPQSVAVGFTVEARPTLPTIALTPASLSFAAAEGGASPAPRTVAVSNSGGGALAAPTVSVVTGGGWLQATIVGTTVTVTPTTSALGPGSYFGTVEVASAGATNSPASLPVSLAVAASCGALADACTTGAECCSGTCGPNGCALFCEGAGESCASDSDCCSMSCTGGTCDAAACLTTGTGCTDATDCCSGICTGGTCAAPPGGTCKTLGEACAGPLECCSKTCPGADPATSTQGWCAPASSCNAPGDICSGPNDCCSGLCSAAAGGVGRCLDASGDCTQDGIPCENDSNCCTRKCVDLGAGTKVCQPSGGCRMTGNFCDRTSACCGGTNEADPSLQSTYQVFCDGIGESPGPTEWDVRTQDSRTCTGGTACNPPGNICGYKASQNCCYEGTGSGKAVCKPDANGILRCFGGPVNTTCQSGWDGTDPNCCIEPGAVCQFRDQCCGGAPCVPDSAGILRCTAASCVARGGSCAGVTPDPCCDGTACSEGGICEPPFSCDEGGADCTVGADGCCSGLCVPLTSGGATGTCADCAPNGNACTTGSQCCSGACDPDAHVCVAPCVGQAGTCTVDGDCCGGLACDIPPGSTHGTCQVTSTCAATGQTCAADVDCCNFAAGETCVSGACTPPSTCRSASQSCTFGGGECCDGLSCLAPDPAGGPAGPCTDGASCFCDVEACVPSETECTGGAICCAGSTCVEASNELFPCPDPEATCVCKQTFTGG